MAENYISFSVNNYSDLDIVYDTKVESINTGSIILLPSSSLLIKQIILGEDEPGELLIQDSYIDISSECVYFPSETCETVKTSFDEIMKLIDTDDATIEDYHKNLILMFSYVPAILAQDGIITVDILSLYSEILKKTNMIDKDLCLYIRKKLICTKNISSFDVNKMKKIPVIGYMNTFYPNIKTKVASPTDIVNKLLDDLF